MGWLSKNKEAKYYIFLGNDSWWDGYEFLGLQHLTKSQAEQELSSIRKKMADGAVEIYDIDGKKVVNWNAIVCAYMVKE